jgi:predicted transcriptional regulator
MNEIYFPPRELEVMSILWRLGSATVAEVRDALEEKGYVRHEPEGRAYRYFPTIGAERAGGSALARIKDAIFHGSAERMFAQFVADRKLGREELERMRRLLAERLKEES